MKYPTFGQIREICEAALKFGIRHLDMYCYRIGDFVVTDENWHADGRETVSDSLLRSSGAMR